MSGVPYENGVVVPARQRPAQLNKVTRVLTPPSRVIRFDSRQQEDDGQLSGYLVQKLKQSRTDATEAISRFVEDTAADLKDKGSVVLEGLGTLSREGAGDIAFSPDAGLSQRITLFELPKLNIPAPHPIPEPVPKPVPVTPAPHIPPVAKVTRQLPAPSSRNKRRWWIPAAILLVLAGLAGAVYYTGNYKSLIHDVKTIISGNDMFFSLCACISLAEILTAVSIFIMPIVKNFYRIIR